MTPSYLTPKFPLICGYLFNQLLEHFAAFTSISLGGMAANSRADQHGHTPSIDEEKREARRLDGDATLAPEYPQGEDPNFRRKEARVVAKLDLYVCPILIVLQLISFLDRGNIGFAATQGMTEDLKLVGNQLNTAVSIFYPLYILAEFPAALIVKRLGFNRVIPTAALCWGVVCLGNGFVTSFAGLAICRLLLGMFEGFLFPSLTLMLANWYKREEVGLRISYLFSEQ